eukprot:GHVP01028161.1.p1 GENE.GHVP01028161.1~~GHVP01028161.1.p1  ORF type:complete len:481 (-),score=102.42 GHVP01028161.1:876-2318(-)
MSSFSRQDFYNSLVQWLSKSVKKRGSKGNPTQPCPLCRSIFNETQIVRLTIKLSEDGAEKTPQSTTKMKVHEKIQELMEQREEAEQKLEAGERRNDELRLEINQVKKNSSVLEDKLKVTQRAYDELRTKQRNDNELLEAARYWEKVNSTSDGGFDHLMKTFHHSADHKVFLFRLHNMLLHQKEKEKSLVAQIKEWKTSAEEIKRKFETSCINLNTARKEVEVMRAEWEKLVASKKSHKEAEKNLRLQVKVLTEKTKAISESSSINDVQKSSLNNNQSCLNEKSVFDDFDMLVGDLPLSLDDSQKVYSLNNQKKRSSEIISNDDIIMEENEVPSRPAKRWLAEDVVETRFRLLDTHPILEESSSKKMMKSSAMGAWAALEKVTTSIPSTSVKENQNLNISKKNSDNEKDVFDEVFENPAKESVGSFENDDVEILEVKESNNNPLLCRKSFNFGQRKSSSKPKIGTKKKAQDIRAFFAQAGS